MCCYFPNFQRSSAFTASRFLIGVQRYSLFLFRQNLFDFLQNHSAILNTLFLKELSAFFCGALRYNVCICLPNLSRINSFFFYSLLPCFLKN